MRKQMVPLAFGFIAIAVAPPQTQATEQPSNLPPVEVLQPTQIESPAKADEMAAPNSEVAQTEMPIGNNPPFSTSDPAGVLSFEPPPIYSTATSSVPGGRLAFADKSTSSQKATQPSKREARRTELKPNDRLDVESGREHIFAGGSESLVARTVGAAEGTRTIDGGKTDNYYGHSDPGNGIWNRGTFSYQFGNQENLSPDEADRRQLKKIKRIHESVMRPKAEKYGVAPLTLSEEINGIDLINQAPLAVTEEGGYIEQLAEVKKKGLSGEAAILEARVQAFWDPEMGRWDAPGLRAYDDISKEESIRRDQERRMRMIFQALDLYEKQNGEVAQAHPEATGPDKKLQALSNPDPVIASLPNTHPLQEENSDAIADAIIFNGL